MAAPISEGFAARNLRNRKGVPAKWNISRGNDGALEGSVKAAEEYIEANKHLLK